MENRLRQSGDSARIDITKMAARSNKEKIGNEQTIALSQRIHLGR